MSRTVYGASLLQYFGFPQYRFNFRAGLDVLAMAKSSGWSISKNTGSVLRSV